MQRAVRFFTVAGLAAGFLAFAGCNDDPLILCGSSFGPPMEELAKMFEEETAVPMVISYGGSEDLLPHVKDHIKGDVFVSHDPYMDYTKEADAMLRWVPVGHVTPVIVVPKGNPKNIESIGDLTRDGLRVILPNPEFSTCGEMVFALLEKKGIKEQVLKNVGNRQFRSHADIGNKMKLGHGDVAIMWKGVAHNYLDVLEIVDTPYEYDEDVRVGVIGLSYSKNQDAVEKFLKFVEEHGEEVFAEFGYTK